MAHFCYWRESRRRSSVSNLELSRRGSVNDTRDCKPCSPGTGVPISDSTADSCSRSRPAYDDLLTHSRSWPYDGNNRFCERLSQGCWFSDLNLGFGGDIDLFSNDIGSSWGNGHINGDCTETATSCFTGSLPCARRLRLFLSGHRDSLRKIREDKRVRRLLTVPSA